MKMFSHLFILFLSLILFACEKKITQSIVDENPVLGVDKSIKIDATSYKDWQYFKFSDNELLQVSISQPETDCNWDLGIMRNHFRTNSGTSGNCNGGSFVDSSTIFTEESWSQYSSIDYEIVFIDDGIIDNIYDITDHTFSESTGSNVLETWGWFDLVNNYQFIVQNYKFLVRVADGQRAYKIWIQDYYNELGQSGHITLRYNTQINFIENIIND